MNAELKLNIVTAMESYMAKHKISQNEFAAKSRVNVAYISAMFKHKFETNAGKGKMVTIAPKWFIKIAEFIGYNIEKTYWNTVVTDQFAHIISILEDAKNFGYINTIIGETGCGKSFSSTQFAKKHPTDLFIVTVGSSDNLGDLLDKLLDKLGLPTAKTKSAKIRDITKHLRDLRQQGRKPMIIFDESEFMKLPTLCMMKELYDHLYTHCAIVMMGTNQLLNNLDKLRRRNKPGIPQLFRRIKFGIRVLPPIDRSFKQFLKDLDTSLKKFLIEHCDNYGELHDVLVPVMREAERTGEPLTATFARKVLGMVA
jgi:DNA transposition AAA+ family ATPase